MLSNTYELKGGIKGVSTFQDYLWPEEPTPLEQINCCECGLNKHGSRMIWGEGNPEAPIVVLLDNPVAREDREGSPIVCGTRQTLQNVIHQVGLDVTNLYVTYVLKRRPVRAYDKPTVRKSCIRHLYFQLEVKSHYL
ncbi:uracil-DNA glycosylase family protein [Bacillus sp. JCM 19034]|uniref:uracil-DNA glycosylase family protein n=1 Tax=Bacillus sp. JCM 19034 TaxID=1481928 RepID=UPI000AEE43D9|nr:uracil-DNA glycosylase family protein [Bacillus sp. JCM 19034]